MNALPKPPKEVPVQRDTMPLAPKFRVAVEVLLHRMEQLGYDPYVFEAMRTQERQRFLYGFGREYDDGRGKVTHSQDADETWHGFGLAVDIISKSKRWGAEPEFWVTLECEAEELGLRSGRDWDIDNSTRERFVDSPHIQWGPPMRRSPSVRAARLRDQGGLHKVWEEVGAL